MKIFLTLTSGLLMSGTLIHARETAQVDERFLSALRAEAASNHPASASARLRQAAALDDIHAVRLWDDPSVGLYLMAADKMMRAENGDIRIGIEQPIPKPGLYAANLSKADAIERAETENARLSALEVGAAAAKDAIELALADESITLLSAQLEWLRSMAENAREMAINPDATSVDALRIESEVARENEVLDAARRSRDGIAQSLNLRLGRKLDSSWPALNLSLDPAPVPVASAEIARISRVNPKVRSMREMASAASADVRIADRDRIPQFAVAADASIYSGGEVRSVGIGLKMSLPYFNRSSYDARLSATRLREEAVGKDVESIRLDVASAVVAAVTDAANASAQARSYAGDIYQKTLTARDSVQASWISSRSGLTDLLDSNRLLFSLRLEQRRYVAMQLAALEDLNLLVPHNSPSK